MPIKINADLPAVNTLEQENIFVMTEQRAETQEIRPLKVAIVNLMPTREVTEVQLLRLLGNTPLQIEISLIRMENHKYKHTGKEYLEKMRAMDMEIAGEFIVMASELMFIKSRMLLPKIEPEEEDPRERLAQALLPLRLWVQKDPVVQDILHSC